MARPRLKVYWCETDDHHEDWFVVARRAAEAVRFFRAYEGYGDAHVRAELAMVLPTGCQDDRLRGWPARELLEAGGARIVRWETPRVVERGGRRWVEGMLEHQVLLVTDDLFERRGRGRPNGTRRSRIA
jgi:hypothetical protein